MKKVVIHFDRQDLTLTCSIPEEKLLEMVSSDGPNNFIQLDTKHNSYYLKKSLILLIEVENE